MQWKRNACLVFGIAFGLGLTALVARYGYISSDDPKTGAIVAFVYAGLAGGALFGEGICVQVWRRSRGLAVVGALVLGIAAITNISNSLDAVVGRSAKTYAAMTAAKDARTDNKDEKRRLEAQRQALTFTPTPDEAVIAAKDAVASAEAATKAECGTGDPKQRGKFCREREADERTARADLKAGIDNNALTAEAARLDARIAELAQALSKVEGVQDAETARQGGSMAIARLFRLPTTWADWIADWKMLVLSAVLDLLVMIAFVFYEVLGWPTREERRTGPRSVPPAEPAAAKGRFLAMLYNALGRPQCEQGRPSPSAALASSQVLVVTKPAPTATVEPKALSHSSEPQSEAHAPARPRPKLVATTKQPLGAVLDFLHDGMTLQGGARTEMTDAFVGYSRWCKTQSLRPLAVGAFVDGMDDCCKRFGLRTHVENDIHYLLDVQLNATVPVRQAEEKMA